MTLRTPPSWLQNGSHPAENDRNTITNSLWYGPGVVDFGDMKVNATGTPSMAVTIAAGRAVILGTQTATQSLYIAFNDATATVSIATSDPTNPRIDKIVATVQDAYYGGTANNQVIYQAVTGSPSPTPVAPSTPNNSLVLAEVYVAAGVTFIGAGNITDARTIATLSDTVTTSSATAANSMTVNTIVSQTGKALKINDSSGAQVFAVSPNGTLTFQDGTTQNTASVYDPNIVVNTETGTTYAFVLTDAQKLVTFNNANPITVTLESNATVGFDVGASITISQFGAGQVEIIGASSPNPVTILSTPGNKLRTQYSTASLIQIATDTWLFVGDLSA